MVTKKIVFWLSLFVIMIVVIDAMLYATMSIVNESRNLFYDRTDIPKERIEFWLENSYHSVLGWDLPVHEKNNLGTRKEKDYSLKKKYKIKTFGDSFTYGAEVGADETWQAYVEQKTAWDCLNYGVGAFGTDQAYLKYKATSNIESEYTVLGILCENIGRIASIYPAFYMREWAPPKPKFVIENDTLRLLENPISTPDSAFNLLDKKYVRQLKELDYWPHYYEKVLGAPAKLTWPAFNTVLRHLPFFLNRTRIEYQKICCTNYDIEIQSYKYYHLYENPNEVLEVLKRLIRAFVELCQSRNEHPIIIVFPDQFSVDLLKNYAKNPYKPLIDFLTSKGYDFLDFGALFVKENYAGYYNYRNSHFSPRGNMRVAEELAAFIRILDAQKTATNGVKHP